MLRALAPAKINLSLFLGPTRADGRHELVTVFESLSLADELRLTVRVDGGSDRVICPGVDGDNLAQTAIEALRERGWSGPPVEIRIIKRIPVAAGMGGGSADAAATLRLAMALAPGRPEEVDAIAASLGADVPSQLVPGLSLGTGAGDMVEAYPPLAPHALVIVPSASALSTAAVYREADRLGLGRSREELDGLVSALRDGLRPEARLSDELLTNDLAPAAQSLCPSIEGVLDEVRDLGAQVVLVCGSGPTVAGIWWGEGASGHARQAAEALRFRHRGAAAATPVGYGFALPIPD